MARGGISTLGGIQQVSRHDAGHVTRGDTNIKEEETARDVVLGSARMVAV